MIRPLTIHAKTHARMSSKAPTAYIPKGLPLRPEQVVTSSGRRLLSNRGGTESSRAAVMHGYDSDEALESLMQDLGFDGPLTADLREQLLNESGMRELPLGGPASMRRVRPVVAAVLKAMKEQGIPEETVHAMDIKGVVQEAMASRAHQLPIKFGGILPGKFHDRDELLRTMNFHPTQLQTSSGYKGPFSNQRTNMEKASKTAVMALYTSIEAAIGFGAPFPELFTNPNRHSTIDAHAFPGLDNWFRLFEAAYLGRGLSPHDLMFALEEAPGSLFDNIMKAPRFDYGAAGGSKENPQGLERVVPDDLATCRIANTSGPNISIDGACAAFLYGIYLGALLLESGRVDAVTVNGSDATLTPMIAPATMPGFGAKAPISDAKLVMKLISHGIIPPLEKGESAMDRWDKLPRDLRRDARQRAISPGTNDAAGLGFADGSGTMNLETLLFDLEVGEYPNIILAGKDIGGGESGQTDMAGMSQGGITTNGHALDEAKALHGVVPNVTYLHGTSTRLFNIAEIMMMNKILAARGISGMYLSALQAIFGHNMGAAGAILAVMASMSLEEQATPLMINFDKDNMDKRYEERVPEALERMIFEPGVFRGSIPAILLQAFGFGNKNGSVVFKHVPQGDKDAAKEVFRDYHATDDQLARWTDKVDERQEYSRDLYKRLRNGELTHHDIAVLMGHP